MGKNKAGLLIVVDGTRWDAFGENTWRSRWLYKMLQRAGGINESVTPGNYVYNVKREGTKIVQSLLPTE